MTEELFQQALASTDRLLVNTVEPTAVTPDGTTISGPRALGITSVLAQPAFVVEKQVDKPAIGGATTLNYTISVTNAGNQNLTGIAISDLLAGGSLAMPESLTLSGPSGDGGAPDVIDVGETWTYAASYDATAADVASGNDLVNTVSVTANEVPVPETAEATTEMVASPLLHVGKAVDKAVIGEPETLTYTITVENIGNVPQDGIALADVVNESIDLTGDLSGPAGDTGGDDILDPGEVWTYAVAYTPTQEALEANPEFVNMVSVTSNQIPDPETASATTLVAYLIALEIEKSGAVVDDGNGLAGPGDVIEYSFVVTNAGNVALDDVTPRDPGPTFNGVPGEGAMSAFSPAPVTLAPGESQTFTATYIPAQSDFDNGAGVPDGVENAADATALYGTTLVVAPPSVVTLSFPGQDAVLGIEKTGEIIDDGDGFAGPGDVIEYSFVVTNEGDVPLDEVTPRDPGPSFDGVRGQGTMSAFSPDPVTLAPGESQTFTATYTPVQADFDNGAGVRDGVTNTAEATGLFGSLLVVSAPATVSLTMAEQYADVGFVKQALVETIRRGETAPFAIIIDNRGESTVGPAIVTDLMPPGFVYVEDSATLDGAPVDVTVSGREIVFSGITVPPGGQATIGLVLRALPATPPGTYINGATIVDDDGDPEAPDTEAPITIVPEAIFDCTDVICRVFNDINRNGYQDDGEPGLPGVRIATVRGTLITTDAFGRYSIPCAELPNPVTGSNFVLKLDPRTLPTGFAMTTPNPAAHRLTAGIMAEMNFGAALGREVRIDLDAAAFVPGFDEPGADLTAALDQLIGVLMPEAATLTLSYAEEEGDTLGQGRLARLRDLILDRWRQAGAPYDLVIDLTVVRR